MYKKCENQSLKIKIGEVPLCGDDLLNFTFSYLFFGIFFEEAKNMTKIKIDSGIYDRAKKVTAAAGYSSVEEFITHAIEDALARHETTQNNEKTAEQLRGLGYIE